jgi:hypothetical protein
MPWSATKRALIAAVVLCCLAAAGAGFYLHRLRRPAPGPIAGVGTGVAPDILSLLPADAPGVAYIDVAALRKMQSSPLAAALGLANGSPAEDREYEDFVRSTGFDYTRDLDRVGVAFWPASYLAPSRDADANRTVAVADGRFDEQKIKAYALRTGKVMMHGTQSVYEVPGNPTVAFEFLSPTRIILASGKAAAQLLDVSNSTPRDPAMQARITRVAAAPVFAIARTDNLPPSVYANFRNSPQLGQIARDIHSLTLVGEPAGEIVLVVLEGECTSTTNAIEIATFLDTFRVLGSMALMDPKTRGQMTKEQVAFLNSVLREVKVTHDRRFVRLTLDVTPAMLAPAAPQRPQATN